MATCLQFALSNPTPGREEEFNRWYGGEHFTHGVLTPGVLAGQRFRRMEAAWPSGKHDYMMIWEFDDPAYALEQLAQVRGTAKMPVSDAIDMTTVQPPTMWLRASARNKARIPTDTSKRGSCVLVLANAAPEQEEAFSDALVSGGLARLADLPGVLCADFLTLADEQIRGNARKYKFALLIELHDEAKALESLNAPLTKLPHLSPDNWLAPAFRPLGPRMTSLEARSHPLG